jgi:two-component system, chemotaxis family, CheB/CheR fusion protein
MSSMQIPEKILPIHIIDGSQPTECFPVVGIGASAGGLEAFRQLLSHLPIDTGMAFVLIQHLEPNQKSLLSEILARETTMPVVEVRQGMAVEPNCVYVIPPSTKMVILQGLLHLTPRDKTHGIALPIDAFFLSLAVDRGSKAIAVVLSGGESDGAKGLEAVKEAGGTTFAQCEASAKVSSMPNTAVATGQVDFVLPPSAIAEELAKISRHPYVVHPTPAKVVAAIANGETALQAIFNILQNTIGVDFTLYKHTTLKRRILRRMVLYRLETLENYATYLQGHGAEVQALYEDILINVTSFFRDSIAFATLASKVFPAIANRTPDAPIRIWVVGCSTGEEVYSIAICLLEFLDTQAIKPPIQIYATDISDWAIEKARKGIYQQNRVADVSPERLQRFFVPVEDGYQIGKSVRELCVFAKQNLCSDPPFSKLDLISCRNVLIYLGMALQKKVFPIFHYALKPTGFLLLGTSETTGKSSDLFTVIDKKYKIYARKLASTRLSLDLIANTYASEITHPALRNFDVAWSDIELHREADRLVLDRYAPVGIVINSDLEIVHFRGQTSPYLESAPGRASHHLLKMAKEGLKLELRTAIHQAKQRELPVRKVGLQLQEGTHSRAVSLEVIPIQARGSDERYFLVLFEDVTTIKTPAVIQAVKNVSRHRSPNSDKQEIIRLNQELENTKEYLRSIIEEQESTNQDLRAANEEILSSNEEFQSSNEELETAKEEIQATNEELNTINDELQHRNVEITQVSRDLQNLISSTNIPILMLSSDLYIRRFTPLAQSILHLIPADVGRPLRDISPTLQMPDLEAQIQEVMDTLTIKQQEVQDQAGHWYDLRIRPYQTIDNKIDGVILVLIDINALKQGMVELQYSHNYTQAIVETMREALIVLDKDLRVFTANQSFYRMFQTTTTETENHLIFELGNGQWNTPQLRLLLLDILPRHAQLQDFEVEHDFEGIGQKIMLLNARTMTQLEGGDSILLAIEDITDRKRLEADLAVLMAQEQLARNTAEVANHAKDEFLAMVSHELRAPLTAILGWTHLLNKHSLPKAKVAQALEVIDRSAKAQAQLIEDLLDISSITAGNFQLKTRPLQLASVIVAAIEVVTIAAEAKQIHLNSRLEPGTNMILGDPERLQQVIWNLLINAIKFTPSGGWINVNLAYIDNQAQITFTDTGCGIDREFLPCVFERFRQADISKTRSSFGLGLGLSIVQSLVELHGGTVGVTSPGKDQGTTFTVRLPLRANLPENNAPLAVIQIRESEVDTPEEIPSLVGVRVLVVDDEADVRQLLAVVLEHYGVTITVVASAQEAIAALTTNPKDYDVLLSDIGMPGEDGYTLIRQIRTMSAEAGGQIPAAALTGFGRKVDHDAAIAAGFQWHLAKPVKQDQLLLVVATLAGRTKTDANKGNSA